MAPGAPDIIHTEGRLPAFWPRSVVFFANLLSLFFGNEDETTTLAEAVGEVDSYGGRLVPILDVLFGGADNLLVLERAPDAALCGYFGEDLGLGLPRMEIMSHGDYLALGRALAAGEAGAGAAVAGAAAHGSPWIDGFVTDATLAGLARQLGKRTIASRDGSWRGNNKLLLHEHLAASGLPAADTEVADAPADVARCCAALAARGYAAAVLRAQIGASGIGMVKLPGIADGPPAEVAEHLFFEGPCLVQGWLEPGVLGVTRTRSPSAQLFLDEGAVHIYDLTEQILSSASVHEGNESPPPYLGDSPGLAAEMQRLAGAVGQWLHGVGYRGTASVDFLLIDRAGGARDLYVCEVNARVTGATYPSVLARRFAPGGGWLMRNLRLGAPQTGAALLAMLDRAGHLFRPGRREGVLPINFNFGPDGLVHKGQFLCLAATPEGCREYLELARRDMPVKWSYDRD